MVRRDDAEADDAELAARAIGDRRAFGVLYDRYATAVYRYCYRRLGDRATAEDAMSGAFLRAMEALPSYRGGSFPAWLFAITHSVVVSGARRRVDERLDNAPEPSDGAVSPEEEAVASDERRRIVGMLAVLPEDQRRVVELRLAGLSGAEIAASMERSTAAVKMLQHRAMRRLRRSMTDHGFDEGSANE